MMTYGLTPVQLEDGASGGRGVAGRPGLVASPCRSPSGVCLCRGQIRRAWRDRSLLIGSPSRPSQ